MNFTGVFDIHFFISNFINLGLFAPSLGHKAFVSLLYLFNKPTLYLILCNILVSISLISTLVFIFSFDLPIWVWLVLVFLRA
jgi:hypothetical protein